MGLSRLAEKMPSCGQNRSRGHDVEGPLYNIVLLKA